MTAPVPESALLLEVALVLAVLPVLVAAPLLEAVLVFGAVLPVCPVKLLRDFTDEVVNERLVGVAAAIVGNLQLPDLLDLPDGEATASARALM